MWGRFGDEAPHNIRGEWRSPDINYRIYFLCHNHRAHQNKKRRKYFCFCRVYVGVLNVQYSDKEIARFWPFYFRTLYDWSSWLKTLQASEKICFGLLKCGTIYWEIISHQPWKIFFCNLVCFLGIKIGISFGSNEKRAFMKTSCCVKFLNKRKQIKF